MESLWRRLPRPIHALAPMEDVTDTVFRRIVARCGRPDVFFTEFVHTNSVLARRRRRAGVTPRLVFTPDERPLVAQIWGNDPEAYYRAAVRIAEMGFDGLDINMGCPVRKIRKKGSCSALIRQPSLAAELIGAAKEGVAAVATARASDLLPVSVKTRVGFDQPQTEEWVSHLLGQGIDALTVHGRTAAQESEGEADWNEIERAAAIADAMGVSTAVLGNGDVMSRAEIHEKVERYRLDGVMVGRGIFSDPYLFATDGSAGRFGRAEASEKIDLLLAHLRLFRDTWGETRNYEILKKFYKIYLTGFTGAEALREELNHTHTYDEAEATVAAWTAASPRSPTVVG